MRSSSRSPARCSLTGDRLLPDDLAALSQPRQVVLAFATDPAGRTFPKRQRAAYPFHVGRALYLPGDPAGFCTVYLQSCSGGIFQHDRLGIAVRAEPGSRVHLTTSASTVVHAMDEGDAEHDVLLEAEAGSLVEYLPDPQILFPRSRLANRLVVRAHPTATVIACDSFLPHDPAGGANPFGWLRSDTRIEDDAGRLLAADRFAVTGAASMAGTVGVQGAFRMQASLMVVHRADPEAALAALRSVLSAEGAVYAGASLLPGHAGAWLRALSSDAVALRRLLRDGWAAAREQLTGLTPGIRRK
jgi:urease accessory protein